jgi:hypothetical protein
MRTRIVSWLLRLYPTVWRNEYGAELADMLRARPLTAGVCSDVVFSAMWQRARATQASTWVGLGLMFAVIAAIASNIASAPAYQESVLPEHLELLQKPLRSEFYVLILFGIGFWTAVAGAGSSGRAAMRASVIASIPIALTGLLMLINVLEYVEVMPGQIATSEPRDRLHVLQRHTADSRPRASDAPAGAAAPFAGCLVVGNDWWLARAEVRELAASHQCVRSG